MITDEKVSPTSGIASKLISGILTPVIDQTKTIVRLLQIPFGFQVQRASGFASGVTSTVTVDVRIANPGETIDAVTLAIGTTKSKFKLSTTLLRYIGKLIPATGVPALHYKATQDNISFSSAFTVNLAGAAGNKWGACRVQIDSADVITTKVVSADQAFGLEADALRVCPAADSDKVDLGTITFETATGATFTAGTTLLDAVALDDVNYNGRASGLASVLTGEIALVATESVAGVVKPSILDKTVVQAGGVVVVDYTTSHTGAAVNANYDVFIRPYPMAGDTPVRGNQN